ncbi:MAG: hypothetical protein QOE60_1370, partial [Thermoleophilaceae bacterium]|nr:hypothetical protein [Thermoleophilaceae bacterium]
RLALSDADADATRALDATSATRAMPRTSHAPPAYAEPTAPPPRRDDREARRAARRRRMASFFALLLVLAAVAAGGVAVISSSNSGGGAVSPVNADNVQQQIQELRQLIEQNTR